jgi:hypothetical protein
VKYMLIMRATDEAYAAFKDVDFNDIIESMGRFNDQMISAGVLVAADHAGQEDARDRAGAVRGAAARRVPQAARPGAKCALPDLHRGLDCLLRK